METPRLLFSLLSLLIFSSLQKPTIATKKSYVVYLGGHSHGPEPSSVDLESVTDSHHEFLGSFLGSKEKAQDAMFYSYTRHINGFAANLDEDEAEKISKHPDVISVFLNKRKKLRTTHSWDFLGLERHGKIPKKSLWHKAEFGKDVIIGNLDTGVWPESQSFSDEGMGPVPIRWKGFCQNNTKAGVQCNRKLIGARYFYNGKKPDEPNADIIYSSARDLNGHGHGTHTLSTAGGSFVEGVNVFGLGNGTAKGGSPGARVAAYKVCWPKSDNSTPTCPDASLMAAFDAAIHDGVDVLSVSLGDKPSDYKTDSLAIGSFHAAMNGIPVVASAGNSGPTGNVENVAPWIITVGASTIDRVFATYIDLGNKMRLMGRSLGSEHLPVHKLFPLIRAEDAKSFNTSESLASLCTVGSLDRKKVMGKIVACLSTKEDKILNIAKGKVVSKAGGVGMIIVNDESKYYSLPVEEPHILPASHLTTKDGLALFAYMDSTKNPVAYIAPGTTELGFRPSPMIYRVSSPGPNIITPEILKPDIIAPGVSIIAAFPLGLSASHDPDDTRQVKYNTMTGTSMSCPHVAGIVGLLKKVHPDWSPGAIKSALMTTARIRDNTKGPLLETSRVLATPFKYGAGHVWPNRAMDPGLVYDLNLQDYLNFLCGVGYNSALIAKFSDKPYICPKNINLLDFNYPAITIPQLTNNVTVTRKVKNVGSPGTYNVSVIEPFGVSVDVVPKSLNFMKAWEEKTFKVIIKAKGSGINEYVFGNLVWFDGVHHVRSHISIGPGV